MMDTQTHDKPTLEVKTDYEYTLADGLPRITKFLRRQTPLSPLSPLVAHGLPSPIQPSTPCYDMSMRQHERAMVGRLDRVGRQSVAPTAEQAVVTQVGLAAVMDSPVQLKTITLPVTAPSTPHMPTSQSTRNRSLAEESRSILLSGMTPSQAYDLGAVANRRLSEPAYMVHVRRQHSLLLMNPKRLLAFGEAYLGDPTKADVFVTPYVLRRQGGGRGQIRGKRLFIQARVRPRTRSRKPFVISRNFDIDQLRTTLPSSMPPSSGHQSMTPLSPEDVPGSARSPMSPLARCRRDSSVVASGHEEKKIQQMNYGSKEMPVRKSI